MDSFTFVIVCLLCIFGFSPQEAAGFKLQMTPEHYVQIKIQNTPTLNITCILRDADGKAVPLAECGYKEYFSNTTMQFNEGLASLSYTDSIGLTGKYQGQGLQHGECGLTIGGYDNTEYILGCWVKPAVGGVWHNAAMLLDVVINTTMQYHLEPQGVTLAPAGSEVTRSGKAEHELDWCGFRLPPADNLDFLHFSSGPASDNHSLARYQGLGLDNKECGITLVNVQPERSGFVVGFVGISSPFTWAYDFIELVVITVPDDYGMTNATTSEDGILSATCWAKNSRPVANITWLLDDKVIRQDSTNDAPAETEWLWNHDPQSITQHLLHRVTGEDNGKQLVCRVGHMALPSGAVKHSEDLNIHVR